MTSERTLIKRAKTYDPAALGELYDQYAPKMYAYIYRRVSDAALAEDLTGELFLRVLRSLQNGRAWRKSVRGWLYRVAHNLVVDYYRQRPPTSIGLDDVELIAPADSNPAAELESALAAHRLREAIAQLTADQQQVLVLRFGEGLTARETGEVMGKTTGAVEALQRRGLAALRRILEGDEEE